MIICLLLAPSVLAFEVNIADAFGMVGEQMSKILANEYAVFIITLGIGSIMLKGVIATGLAKIPQIEGSGHINSIAWSVSILAVLAFVWGSRGGGMKGLLNNLGVFKPILLVLFIILIYSGVKKTFRGD